MDTLPLTLLNYSITNIFHYLHVNVMLISDHHQARQWLPPWPLSQLAMWKIVSQLHYLYYVRDWRERSKINASKILPR